MSASNKRLHHRHAASLTPSGLRGKSRITTVSRMSNATRETDSSVVLSHDLNRTMNPRLLRHASNEVMTVSPYAVIMPIPRSKSQTKAKNRVHRATTPEKCLGAKGKSEQYRSQISFAPMLTKPSKRRHISEKPPLNQTMTLLDQFRTVSSGLNLSFNNSFNTSLSALPSADSPQRQKEGLEWKLRAISSDLQSKLSQLSDQGDWRSEMEVCSRAVKDVMALEKELWAALNPVVSKYEGWIHAFADKAATEVVKAQTEILALQNSLLQEIEEKKALKRKFEKISRENVELCRSCETYQNKCFEYQEKLFDLAGVSLEQFPPTEKMWRLLVSELDAHKNWKETAVKELKAAQTKERKLLELLHALKRRGFPIEEVYNSDVKKRPKTERSATESEGEDAQPLVSGPAATRQRPEAVPALQLDAVMGDESELESSSQPSTLHDSQERFLPYKTLSNSSTHSNLTASAKAVPQLQIPSKQSADGFHQEFMARYEEFSESWRKQIDAQRH